jgi:hypothetical protein
MEQGLLSSSGPRPLGWTGSVWTLLVVLAAGLLLYGWAASDYARRFGGNLSGFACVGEKFPAPGYHGPETFVLPGSWGYDGQFYLLAAQDPLILGDAHRYMDVPAYRYQRILYPALAWLAAGGRPEAVPAALVAVNLGAVLLGAVFVGLLAARHGRSPLWALFYPLLSGLLLATLRDLAEPVAMAFLAGGLYAYDARRHWWAALLLALALLAKEIAAVALLALALHALAGRRSLRAFLAMCLAGAPLAAWWGYIWLQLGRLPLSGGRANFGPPLAGMLDYADSLWPPGGDPAHAAYGLAFLAVMLASLLPAVVEFLRGLARPWGLLLILYAGLFACLTNAVWVEPWSYARVTLPLAVVLVAGYAATGSRLYLPALWGHAALMGLAWWWLGLV